MVRETFGLFYIAVTFVANGQLVIRLKQVEHVSNERNVLAKVAGHPFITNMVASFQDHDSLYMLVRTRSNGL
jgi:hypothetical protein